MNSKLISLSAIAAGLTAIALIVGAYIEIADLFALVISSVFVIMPLFYRSYKGSLLCFLAGGVIAFLCSGFNILSLVFPSYFVFFGIFPIVKCYFDDKRWNKTLCFIIGLIWFLLTAYGMYFYYTLVMGGILDGLPSWLVDYTLYLIAPAALIVFVIYNRFITVMRIFISRYLQRVIK